MKNNIDDKNQSKQTQLSGPDILLRRLHSAEGRFADIITASAGSMYFVYLHVFLFTAFFILRPFEVDVFNIFLSLEAIFLATFIMISQNRQALIDTYREYEEEQEQQEEEKEQEELEEEVEDIQKDLDDIKKAITFIQQKVIVVEKNRAASAANHNATSPTDK